MRSAKTGFSTPYAMRRPRKGVRMPLIPASNSPRHHFEPDCLLDDATVFNVAMLGNQNPDTSEVIGGNGNVIVKS